MLILQLKKLFLHWFFIYLSPKLTYNKEIEIGFYHHILLIDQMNWAG